MVFLCVLIIVRIIPVVGVAANVSHCPLVWTLECQWHGTRVQHYDVLDGHFLFVEEQREKEKRSTLAHWA
jgi:hypothetical protein